MGRTFATEVKAQIGQKKPKDIRSNLVDGMFLILREMQGYTHFDFISDDFTAAQYFLLIELLRDYAEKQKKEQDKIKNKTKKR